MEGIEYITTKNGGVIKLPPGFRFHPTDEELVVQYLRRKVASLPLPATVIPEINLWKYNPWELHVGGGEGERYFFTTLEDVKHLRRNKSIRTTDSGFWKTKGKSKPIFASRGAKIVGMKRSFVFHQQEKKRSHKINASRTSWIMEEYRLPTEVDAVSFYMRMNAAMVTGLLPLQMKDWVVCKIFQKDSSKRMDKEKKVRDSNNYLVPSPSLSSCLTDLDEEREKEEEEISS
ncbi:NAC domain-containing protein [Rhynchospora pubera]|uniref:NAC domain-containing protein n=1 Tax=Rhynchospora pubera TaxID=906938 RepID=A0AAV8EWM7_9POAL|nr:NAC domain-containing protein [Rhynchospora pubera]